MRASQRHRSYLRSPSIVGAIVLVALMAVTSGPLLSVEGPSAFGGPPSKGSNHSALALATSPQGGLALSITSSQSEICLNDTSGCVAGVGDSLVTLTARGNASSVTAWPAVQMVFVLETTPYDGVYDPTAYQPGNDTCALSGPGSSTLCAESNAVPFFAANAGTIAADIAAAHPGTRFTFGLVDYFATHDAWDDGDGFEYHVDVGQTVAAGRFGTAVNSSLPASGLVDGAYITGSGLSDNILTSDSITALYGTLEGAGVSWTNDTHHVIVWIGSTAPRDPSYPENYCPSPSTYVPGNVTCTASSAANYSSSTCEPSYTFGNGLASPACEGWVSSQDGSVGDSIAALAGSSGPCTDSVGGNCTVDTIDLPTGLTDPYAPAWPARSGGGPGSTPVVSDVSSVLGAGADLASATGGTWDDPAVDGGTLRSVPHGSYNFPNTSNPTLLTALTAVGLGYPPYSISAFGESQPMFTFATTGNIAIDPDLSPFAVCESLTGPAGGCQRTPSILSVDGKSVLEWNWSTDPNSNALYANDTWTAVLQVMAIGPPFEVPVPIDACTTTACLQNGSTRAGPFFTSANYLPPGTANWISRSFPIARVTVVTGTTNTGSSSPPPAPPAGGIPPPVLSPAPVASPVPQPVLAPSAVSVGLVSIQATAAGLLAAGFARVTVGQRRVGLKVAVKSPRPRFRSAFDKEARSASDAVVRTE
jgi:hypothetical protein